MSPILFVPLRRALLAVALLLTASLPGFATQSVTLGWDAVSDPSVAGYRLHYGLTSGNYTQSVEAGSDTTVTVPNLPSGATYYFVVVSYNADALESLPSFEVAVTVDQLNSPPTVTLVKPTGSESYTAPASIPLEATASDSDGSIIRVEFYSGSTILGSATTAPYRFTWSPVNQGTYSLSARAYDDQGGATISSLVSVTVTPNSSGYSGSFTGGAVDQTTGSVLRLNINVIKNGKFTGRIWRGTVSAPLSGQFASDGTATLTVRPPRTAPYTVLLTLAANNTVAVSFPGDSSAPAFDLSAPETAGKAGVAASGRYTMLIGTLTVPNPGTDPLPGGNGAATVTVSRAGAVRVTGRLADNQPFTASARLLDGGSVFIVAAPYPAARGTFAGEISFVGNSTSDGGGTMLWAKQARTGGRPFTQLAWVGTSTAKLSRFTRIISSAVRGTTFHADLAGGDLPQPSQMQADPVFIPSGMVDVLAARSQSLTLLINANTGFVSGSFALPGNGAPRRVQGVLFQKDGTGGGFFISPVGTGDLGLSGTPMAAN